MRIGRMGMGHLKGTDGIGACEWDGWDCDMGMERTGLGHGTDGIEAWELGGRDGGIGTEVIGWGHLHTSL